METTIWLFTTLLAFVLLAALADHISKLSRRVDALNRSVSLLLRHSELWKELAPWQKLALDPFSKIQAIKAYMAETGASLADAKATVDKWTQRE